MGHHMRFRNLQIYRLTSAFTHTPEELNQAIEQDIFKPCGSLALQSYGWSSPLGRLGTQLVHAAAGRILLCARKEEKILPSSVIKEEVNNRALALEDEQARSVGRKERQQIKDEVIFELLPRAFNRSSHTFAYIDPKNSWIIIDATSAKRAEELLTLLRQGVDSLSVRPLATQHSPPTVMTHWLSANSLTSRFMPQDECELRDPVEDGGVIRCRHQDLFADEVMSHISAGKQVTKLAVLWNDRISCIIDDDLSIKRLRFEDVVLEELNDIDSSDELANLDADFSLMTLELEQLIPELIETFGGEELFDGS
jgi:recombination associated protein RdgC